MGSEPIIPGFHPDPSICRVEGEYFIANSSFEYVPGVPIWRSNNLVEWTLVGNALTGLRHPAPSDGAASTGIYAPTLRYHDGRFYLITTNVDTFARGHFIITADDISGPWSDPIYLHGAIGIDPDIIWDEHGVCHVTWASFAPDAQGIVSAPIDTRTGALLSEPRLLWQGTGLASPEGPHLYRRDGWWYLLLAEGGTERGHCATIARSRSFDGPWESCPHNPILTHRSTTQTVQNTGHADLVQLQDGEWAMVHLGVRPRGQTPQFHTNGRETFLVGINWVDDWPVIIEDRYTPLPVDRSFSDHFSSKPLDPRWVAPGRTPDRFTSIELGRLVLRACADDPAARLLAFRPQDLQWRAQVEFEKVTGRIRFLVRLDETHWYGITLHPDRVDASIRIGPAETTLQTIPNDASLPTTLRISAHETLAQAWAVPAEPDLITLSLVQQGLEHSLATVDGRYLSTEVAGGFTGRVIAMEILEGEALVNVVAYQPLTSNQTVETT